MMFVGDSPEHANRVGSTIDQYRALADGPADLDVRAEDIFMHRRFVLEDVNRDPTDTVVGGAFITVVKAGSKAVEAHLMSAFVREEYRGQGLANFAIGRLLSGVRSVLPLTKVFIHETATLSPGLATNLAEKGFATASDGTMSIRMPGRDLSQFSRKQVETADKVTGVHNGTLFQDGTVVGSYEFMPEDDPLDDTTLVMYDADGNKIAEWEDIYNSFKESDPRNNYSVNWGLSAAIRILNPPIE